MTIYRAGAESLCEVIYRRTVRERQVHLVLEVDYSGAISLRSPVVEYLTYSKSADGSAGVI